MELPKARIRANDTRIRGFTIIELLIATGITLVVLGVIGLIYVTSDRSFKFGQSAISSEADLRLAMDWLTRDIREARNVQISGDTVVVILPPESGGVNVYYGYDSNGYLTRTFDSEPSKVIAPVSIDSVIHNPSESTVTIVLSSNVGNTVKALTSQVTMRNWE